MAPTLTEGLLRKRQYGYCDPSLYDCGRYSTWDNWGRWVALAVIVIAFILLALAFSCFNNRRRRRRGVAPMYGTAWMPGSKYNYGNNGQNGYYPNQPYHGGAPAPPYEPPINNQNTGNTFNSNDGYYGHHGYGGQQSGVELQQPSSVYQPQRGGDPVYDAPVGPPPGKGDYVVR